ncbi:hypothetical protein TI05_02345 [Achromatium sp. WMS3]|nr:hypothetical protein TI05_02345 [Achromatium sp. WMS3]
MAPTERTAIISDIHGHYAGLKIVLDDIVQTGCNRIICLGDLVEGGDDNEQVVALMQTQKIDCVQGNHDKFNDIHLAQELQNYLDQLPEQIVEDYALYTHISPRQTKYTINHEIEAWNVFNETSYRLIFVGHTHASLIFGEASTEFGEAKRHTFEYNKPLMLDKQDRYIICGGAIGYGRDGIEKIRYAIFDPMNYSVEIRAINGPLLSFDR